MILTEYTYIALSTSIRSRHCSICNISFNNRKLYLDHDLHFHKTKETLIVNLKTLCCNICNKIYSCKFAYRRHMVNMDNTQVPFLGTMPKPNPLKTPDIEDPNNYCIS